MDTAGNVWEMAVSPYDPNTLVARGGAYFYDKNSASTVNRNLINKTFRHATVGFRVCALQRPTFSDRLHYPRVPSSGDERSASQPATFGQICFGPLLDVDSPM